jgi:hypothetical protein
MSTHSVSPSEEPGRKSISPASQSGGSSRQSPSEDKPRVPAITTITGKPLASRGRGMMLTKLASQTAPVAADMPSGRTSAEKQLAQQLEAVRIEDVKPVPASSNLELPSSAPRRVTTTHTDVGSSDGARTTAHTTSGDSSSKATTQYLSVASTGSKSVERAMDELKVETILRRSPVRRAGEAGVKTTFSTNYIKLKCKNAGVYQYTVQYDPPVDSQFIRCKMVSCGLRDLIGPVKLFDGHTLFLPHLLKDQVSLCYTAR